jgi:hypothetical protein
MAQSEKGCRIIIESCINMRTTTTTKVQLTPAPSSAAAGLVVTSGLGLVTWCTAFARNTGVVAFTVGPAVSGGECLTIQGILGREWPRRLGQTLRGSALAGDKECKLLILGGQLDLYGQSRRLEWHQQQTHIRQSQ